MLATFAAGCFWGIEEFFLKKGRIIKTTVGYAIGATEVKSTTTAPTYEQVCTGLSGYAEAVEVEYDPNTISYNELLDSFWKCHDPTLLNRQGPDIGSQYRSVIFYHSEEQATEARESLKRHQASLEAPIVTKIEPIGQFHRAEEYHQQYLRRKQGLCPNTQNFY